MTTACGIVRQKSSNILSSEEGTGDFTRAGLDIYAWTGIWHLEFTALKARKGPARLAAVSQLSGVIRRRKADSQRTFAPTSSGQQLSLLKGETCKLDS